MSNFQSSLGLVMGPYDLSKLQGYLVWIHCRPIWWV